MLLILGSALVSNTGFAQTYPKTVLGPCTSGETVHHVKKHHIKKHPATGVAVVPKPHTKAIVHRRPVVKKAPLLRTVEAISIDNKYSVAIVNFRDGKIYVNDSLLTSIENLVCDERKIIINYTAPPPPAVTVIEQLKTNTYTGEKAEGMLGLWGSSNCCEDGVVIDDVLPGGPACKAGLGRGDVITKINDQRISSGSDLGAAMKTLSAGDNVSVTVRDYDGTETKHVELAKKDLPADCGGCTSPRSACR